METTSTPMMAQWKRCKQQARGALLLFRLGDFYEAFHEDAALLSRDLEVVLTARQGTPMAGIPHTQLDGAIDRLITKGHRVAVAEQTAATGKGMMSRNVVRIVSAGTMISSSLVAEKVNRYFACTAQVGSLFGLALLDLTTCEFHLAEMEGVEALAAALGRVQPAEWLVSESFQQPALVEEIVRRTGCVVSRGQDGLFAHEAACRQLREQFGERDLHGQVAAINAAGALLAFLKEERALSLETVRTVVLEKAQATLAMDLNTQRHLDLGQLLQVLDTTCTAMGGRLLRRWLLQPLTDLEAIRQRQDLVEELYGQPERAMEIRRILEPIRDLERLVSRIGHKMSSAMDLVHLAASLKQLEPLSKVATKPVEALLGFGELIRALDAALDEAGEFRSGYHADLDQLLALQRDGRGWLVNYQTKLREQLGIRTLKVGYNRVTGYYIEVSRREAEQLPGHFVRRQTLASVERFLSPELSEFEGQLMSSESRLAALMSELTEQLRAQVQSRTEPILKAARAVAQVDVLLALATAARRNNYVRPVVNGGSSMAITEGRHPVVERTLRDRFVPNDARLNDSERLVLITGPNMGGKSTYMRQVALICIMAQMGSFVPARSAHLGALDQIMTRIGASDDLAAGRSTFMVEMAETAAILKSATARSLVILDEIGRGTSTYDGIAIAWAVAEYLLRPNGPKTLFATHYLELTQLEKMFPTAVNWAVQVAEQNGQIAFLHRVTPGKGDRSYGIHVARLAGLPERVVERAEQLLTQLESRRKAKIDIAHEQLTLCLTPSS